MKAGVHRALSSAAASKASFNGAAKAASVAVDDVAIVALIVCNIPNSNAVAANGRARVGAADAGAPAPKAFLNVTQCTATITRNHIAVVASFRRTAAAIAAGGAHAKREECSDEERGARHDANPRAAERRLA